ncbi:MAG: insulinase family protein, partial [Desulforhopalus sp.]
MADYARGALLLDEEVARERGVILAEKRARESAGYRVRVAETSFAFRGTRYPKRMVIGDEQVLKNADQELLRSYYDAWYRPENMILVVVGDADPRLVQRLINKYFAGLSAAGPEPNCPQFGNLAIQGVAPFYYYDPELGRTEVSVETFWDVIPENDSRGLQRRELLQFIGTEIMGYRLEKLLESADLPFSKARYSAGNIINRIGYGSLSAQTDGDSWQESVTLLVKTLRQALRYGFLEQEIDRAKAEILAALDERILTEKTINSRRIASNIIRHLNSNRVYQTPEQEKALYGSILDEISLEDVNGQFARVWNHDNRLISVTGDAKTAKDPEGVIERVYRKALAIDVLPPNDHKNAVFPYLHPPPFTGPLPVASLVKDVDVERLVFPHGLRVNLKKTEFTENTFLFSATFGKGALEEKAPGMAMLAEAVINGSGSSRYRQSEIDALVTGSSVEMSFKAGDAYFSWRGAGLVKDFDLFGQLLYMRLFDIGFRETVFARVKENYALQYQKISREVEGAVPLYIQPFLANYNYHFGLPPWRDLEAVSFEDLAAWAKSSIQPADLEISIVGDFNREDVIALLAKYFGE